MRLDRSELSKAVQTALSLGAVAAVGIAGTAFAQTATTTTAQNNQKQPQTLQTIVVTGSHIREAEIATAQPVITVTRAQIEHQGFTSTADILQNLSVVGSPAITRQQVLSSGEAVGGYYVDIHNVGASRTLVLLNGQRLGTTNGGLADLQQIPVSAIERIEVLKDGASAVYGSDAISGVVNIITRNRYNGAEASGYVGQYDEHSDGKTQQYSFTMGAEGGKGSIMLSAQYSKQDPVMASDRWFSKTPDGPYHPNDGWTVASQYGLFFNYNINTYAPYSPGLCASYYCTLNPGGNPYNTTNGYHPSDFTSGGPDTSNTNQKYALTTGTETKGLFVSSTYDFNDHVHFQSDILYNHRDTTVINAGYPFQPAFKLPGSNTIIGLSPDSYFNPLGNGPLGNGAGDTLWFYRRGWEVDRTSQNELTTYRIGGKFSGDFNIGDHDWNWDVGGFTNTNRALVTNRGNFNLVATAEALGPSYLNPTTGRVECGTAANPIPYGSTPGQCVPWNPMYPAGQVGPGSLSGNPALQTYLFPIYHDVGETKMTDYSANLTGSIVTLPAGDLSVAMGYEYRSESGNFIPDAARQACISTDLCSGPTGGGYTVKSEYLEVNVPILKDIPFFHALSVDAAVRRSKYNTFGSTTNAKLSLTWRPIQDLLVGGTIAHGFRAPQVSDLFGGLSGTFDSYSDPCDPREEAGSNAAVASRCSAGFGGQNPVPAGFVQRGQGGTPCASLPCQTGVQFLSGANPTLQPEKSLSRTAQIVYSPSWFPASLGKVDVSADYFDIYITNAISGDSVDSILHDCYVLGITSRCSQDLFTRSATTGVVNFAQYGERNAGYIRSTGEDLGIKYQLPQTKVGQFTVDLNGTYWSKQESKADNNPTTPVSESNGWGSNFRYRVNTTLDWSLGPWGATWTTRLYSGIKEACSYNNTSAGGPECNMPNYWQNGVKFNADSHGDTVFNDVQARYTIKPINATVMVGVNDVFDKFGPVLYGSARSIVTPYYGGFDIGRFYYVRYVQKF